MSYRFVDSFRAGPGWNLQLQFYHLITILWGVQILTFSLCKYFLIFLISPSFWPKYLPQRLFLEHAQFTSCFNVRDQVSHPYISKPTGETIYRVSLHDALQACWKIPLIMSTSKSRNCQPVLQRTTHRAADRPYLMLS
jgi:hypothetical protein